MHKLLREERAFVALPFVTAITVAVLWLILTWEEADPQFVYSLF